MLWLIVLFIFLQPSIFSKKKARVNISDILVRGLVFGVIMYFLKSQGLEGFQAPPGQIGVIPPTLMPLVSKILQIKEPFQTSVREFNVEGFQDSAGGTGAAPPVTTTTATTTTPVATTTAVATTTPAATPTAVATTTPVATPTAVATPTPAATTTTAATTTSVSLSSPGAFAYPSCGSTDGFYIGSSPSDKDAPVLTCLPYNTSTSVTSTNVVLGVLYKSTEALYMYDTNGGLIDFKPMNVVTILKSMGATDSDIVKLNIPEGYDTFAVALNPLYKAIAIEVLKPGGMAGVTPDPVQVTIAQTLLSNSANAIPANIKLTTSGLSTGAMIGIGVASVAVIGLGVWALSSSSSATS